MQKNSTVICQKKETPLYLTPRSRNNYCLIYNNNNQKKWEASPVLSPSYCLLFRVTQRWSVLWYFNNIFVASLQFTTKGSLKPFLLFFKNLLMHEISHTCSSVPTPNVQHCFDRVMNDIVFGCSLLSCLNNIPLYSSTTIYLYILLLKQIFTTSSFGSFES